MKEKQKPKKIKLLLHHDYLKIECGEVVMQLPVRCAKLIADLYLARGAKNEKEDIEHYTMDFENCEYEVSLFRMGVKHGNVMQWQTKIIPPLDKVEK